jgi:hypothetical protein
VDDSYATSAAVAIASVAQNLAADAAIEFVVLDLGLSPT